MAENIHIKDLNRHRWLMAEREVESDIEVIRKRYLRLDLGLYIIYIE
jgi:hypothetical protein